MLPAKENKSKSENETDAAVLMEIWKMSRDSASHFDKILSDFRKIIFPVNAGLFALGVQLHLKEVSLEMFLVLGGCLTLINFLVWLLEKHYHMYLIGAADLAKRVESEMLLPDCLRLTQAFDDLKERSPFCKQGIHSYDLLYILPMVLGLIPFLFYAIWCGGLLVVGCVLISWVVLNHQHSLEHGKEVQDANEIQSAD